ncbi:hypothetical protein EK21DRAFT_108381 [Setomelanomma holmii]|uniref:Zn(2)-C6 fungal-type domain-containing protein n=1 Tax=Setomelanomma holmii TaxID=210430 RepID=A0A9P4HI36_9PLEO|nr:hypothetical protein EK21DRAFT_108381 [Setomelanomma holmii]
MVGVPGRSKGCITCRKRKKGCDLKQPACGQCQERGITCGGYDADRIFVYLDEGARHQTNRASSGSNTFRTKDVDQPLRNGSLQVRTTQAAVARRNARQPLPSGFTLPLSLCRSAYEEKSLEAFISLYLPQINSSVTNWDGKEIVGIVPVLSTRDEALRLAISAIGTVALSKQMNDSSLAAHGRNLYGKALAETRRALASPSRSRSTAVLAIPRVMALFEILFGAEENTGNQANSWLKHAEGEKDLIVARGPAAYTDDDAHSMFASARWRPLIAAVRLRKRTVLNEEIWKILPWRGRIKTPNDSLLDITAAIPEILENVDRWGNLSSGSPEDEARDLVTSAKCWTLHMKLEEWLATNEHEILTPATINPTPITFGNYEVACLTTRYWVTSLLLYTALDTASGVPPWDESCTHPDRPHPRHFARLITRSVAYFFRPEFGATGATSISFPLGNTMLFMQRNPVVDAPYMAIVKRAWNDPDLPSAIKKFLNSLRLSVSPRSSPGPGEV